jgi:hypothetical protein
MSVHTKRGVRESFINHRIYALAMAEQLSRKTVFIGYGILFTLGLAFYLCWSIMYNTWTDVGVYSISATLMGFGLVGMLLYRSEPKEKA